MGSKSFTIKNGIKFGIGVSIGANVWRGINQAFEQIFSPSVDRFLIKLKNNINASQK